MAGHDAPPVSEVAAGRPDQPEPFLRGCAFPAVAGVPYPRADPADAGRLPADTWASAQLPVGVRLEVTGDAKAVEVSYRTSTDDLGYRGPGAGTSFTCWRKDRLVDEAAAGLGEGVARLSLEGGGKEDGRPGGGRAVIYLPEGMRPLVAAVEGVGGRISAAPPQPRWVVYGDSIAEGWIASTPACAWPAVAGRRHGLDVVNLGYAGAARGEIVSAEQIAAMEADVISISHGTNCWTRIPHSAGMMRETTRAFLDVVRQGHPDTPIVVVSPVIRPDAEESPNRLGATLGDLRAAVEEVAEARVAAGDSSLLLIRGGPILSEEHLPDGIHPGDEGHRLLASVVGPAVDAALGR